MNERNARRLAQVNVATLLHGPDDPRLTSFTIGAQMVARAAARAPGHVWSEQDQEGSRFMTRSVWNSLAELRAFVHSGLHVRYMKRTSEWFAPRTEPSLALWWIDRDERPSVREALDRLARIRSEGPGPAAFDFEHPQGG